MDNKMCGKCKQELDVSCFSKCKKQKDGLMYWCKVCINTHTATRRKHLIIDHNIPSKQCNLCHEVKPRSRFFSSIVSMDGMVAYCKECYHVWKNNKVVNKRGIPGTIHPLEWKSVLSKYSHTCLRCGRTNIQLSIDHIVPVSNSLCTNTISNVQPLCHSCNSSKRCKIIDYR